MYKQIIGNGLLLAFLNLLNKQTTRALFIIRITCRWYEKCFSQNTKFMRCIIK